MLAVLELFVCTLLQIEQLLEVVEFRSLFFELASLFIVLANLLIGLVDDLLTGVSDVEWQIVVELNAEFLNNDAEACQTTFDVLCLLILKG